MLAATKLATKCTGLPLGSISPQAKKEFDDVEAFWCTITPSPIFAYIMKANVPRLAAWSRERVRESANLEVTLQYQYAPFSQPRHDTGECESSSSRMEI